MLLTETNGDASVPDVAATTSKPKRVRTGCLTCRERHLKCDEGLPHCHNCKKSNRICKRGLRLNFIDTQVQNPPCVPPSADWKVNFMDESREIASEYQGGLARYGVRDSDVEDEPVTQAIVPADGMHMDFTANAPQAPAMAYQELPPIQGILPEAYLDDPPGQSHSKLNHQRNQYNTNNHSSDHSPFSGQNALHGTNGGYSQQQPSMDSPHGKREFLNNQEEVLFLQVFVEEVGSWMDSMDPAKHFSRLLPFHSLQEPMLLNAYLACGARHLTLVNPIYTEEKALHYYDTATTYLLQSLQNPNRDSVICATTAVILNVYEIMSERALQRMNHIAGARALIKECGWNARAQGVGAACFWLNVGLEVLSCLHFNWQVAWDPDDWGVDMDFEREIHNGREEIWTHRVLYIVAKVCNFRATIPRFRESDPRDEEIRRQNRYAEWQRLKEWADAWNDNIPRTMHPIAYLYPYQTTSKSAFPEVWLIKRATVVARLFYHTVMVLLAQVHPYLGPEVPEMNEMQNRHSQMICGITAHVKDRGVASVAIRSLSHAAECLTDRREQEEVLQIFSKIKKETGWRIDYVYKELKDKWGWQDTPQSVQLGSMINQPSFQPSGSSMPSFSQPQYQNGGNDTHMQNGSYGHHSSNSHSSSMSAPSAPKPVPAPAQPAPRRPPSGIVNPMYSAADFSMPQHPYQNVYVAPNTVTHHSTGLYY